jgi:hypothetical protein
MPPELRNPVRLLKSGVEFAQPRDRLWEALCAWASQSGRAVYSEEQLQRLHRDATNAGLDYLSLDIQIGFDALAALDLRPSDGWAGYLAAWETERAANAIFRIGEFSLLRGLNAKIGGILLNSRALPFVLILPQPTGTYIQMGFHSISELSVSPFGPQRNQAVILREHQVPEQPLSRSTFDPAVSR